MQADYDPTTASYQSVITWLTSEGFTVVHPDNSHLAVFATGTISQIEKAFGVSFAMVHAYGFDYPSAINEPSVPASLYSAILGVNHLQTFRMPRPLATSVTRVVGQPAYTLTPPEVVNAYNGTSLYNSGINGTGESIAVLSFGVPLASDLTGFWNYCGIPASLRHITYINFASSPGTYSPPTQDTSSEDALDVEWASGIAPGANVRVYEGDVFYDSVLQQIYNDATNPSLNLHLHQVSTSYGEYEDAGYDTSSNEQTAHQYIAQLASAGITFFCGSGDSGYSNVPVAQALAGSKDQMFYPGADSYCTCVGGTDLYTDSNSNETMEFPWLGTSGGVGYVFARPYWQNENWINKSRGTDAALPTNRMGPDVSAPGGGQYGNDAQYPCIIYLNGSLSELCGTSWSGPTWAGFCALFNQMRTQAGNSSFGLLGPYIYPTLANTTGGYAGGNFRDIVPLVGTGPGGIAYNNGNHDTQSTTGFDLVTGIGVPNLATLGQTLATFTPPTPTAPMLTNPPATPAAVVGTPYSFTYVATAYPPATFKVSAGSLPPGLTLDLLSGTLSGTPTKAGTYSGTVDAGNLVGTDATQSFNIIVAASVVETGQNTVDSVIIAGPRPSARSSK
jgi:kumamolisin